MLEPRAERRGARCRPATRRAVRRRRRHRRRRGRGAHRRAATSGELYELTGPRLLTFAEAVAEIGEAPGARSATCRSSVEQHAAVGRQPACPPTSSSCSRTCSARSSTAATPHVADGVRRALGREPRDFADYARERPPAASGTGSCTLLQHLVVIVSNCKSWPRHVHSSQPSVGHLHPLVPVARALSGADARAWPSARRRRFRPEVEAFGLTHVDAGLDWSMSDQATWEVFPPIHLRAPSSRHGQS